MSCAAARSCVTQHMVSQISSTLFYLVMSAGTGSGILMMEISGACVRDITLFSLKSEKM